MTAPTLDDNDLDRLLREVELRVGRTPDPADLRPILRSTERDLAGEVPPEAFREFAYRLAAQRMCTHMEGRRPLPPRSDYKAEPASQSRAA